MRVVQIVVLVGTAAACGAGLGQESAQRPEPCRVPNCLVTIIDRVDVPAQEAGQLVSIEAREGLTVQTGMLLAQIEDEMVQHQRSVAAAELEAAQEKASSDVGVRHAQASAKVAAAEHEQALEANRRQPGTIAKAEERRRELNARTAELQIEQAELDQRVAGLTSRGKAAEVAAADSSIGRRRITAPLDGLVVEVAKRPGEWVQPGEKVLRLVRMDRLRVEGFLNPADFDPQEIDARPVTVEVVQARGRREQLAGKVAFVSPLLEADGTYRIWAEVENRAEGRLWVLRPGAKVEMTVEVESAAEKSSGVVGPSE